MILEELEKLAMKVKKPTRIIDPTNIPYGLTPAEAKKRGITWDIIYIRNDGWSIGCQMKDAKATVKLWYEDWIAVVDCTTQEIFRKGEFENDCPF
jgi:hypothetical protein